MIFRAVCAAALLAAAAFSQTATVPLIVEGNVPMIDLQFAGADGAMHTGRFVLDSGGGAFIITETLANAIGLKATGPRRKTEGAEFAPAAPPKVLVGGMPLDLKDARVMIQYGSDRLDRRDTAVGLFPGHVLERYHVVFDYPARKFTLAAAGSVKPRGTALQTPVRRQNGFARLTVEIGGQSHGFLLDTGASFTMISRKALEAWSTGPARWARVDGAVGPANMGARSDAEALMVRVPELRLGGLAVTDAGAVSRQEGTFERSMSRMMTEPIVGAIGGNVLSQFRVEIDYAAGVTYLEHAEAAARKDLDLVGLTLFPAPDGSMQIIGVSKTTHPDVREKIQAGDLLRSVDGKPVAGLSLMQIVDRLRGQPGDRRKLNVERGGQKLEVEAVVTRVL